MNSKLILSGICAAGLSLCLAACGGLENEANPLSPDSADVPYVDATKNSTGQMSDIEKQLQALLTEQQSIFDANKDLWEKLFSKVDKNYVMEHDSFGYAEILTKTLNDNSKDFTEEEQKALKADIEKIAEIDQKLIPLESELAKQKPQSKPDMQGDKAQAQTNYPAFTGKDMSGQAIDNSYFKNNAVTVVNYWYNNCAPCVAELSDLQKLNDSIKAKGGEVIGVNTETLDNDQNAIKEAERILKEKHASYKQFIFDANSDAYKHAKDCFTFPTTYLVNRDGKIVGEPILGGISNEKTRADLEKRINDIINADTASKK